MQIELAALTVSAVAAVASLSSAVAAYVLRNRKGRKSITFKDAEGRIYRITPGSSAQEMADAKNAFDRDFRDIVR